MKQEETGMNRAYVYRLHPSRSQQRRLLKQLEVCRKLYNYLLDLNIEVYRNTKGKVSLVNEFQRLLKYLKAYDLGLKDLATVQCHVTQDVCDRLKTAFQGFFRRVKVAGEKAGFPRFKGEDRYDSLGFDYSACKVLLNNKVQLSKVGPVKFKQHRSPPKNAKLLSATVRHRAGRWYIAFTYEVGEVTYKPPRAKNRILGIDLGLNNYVMTSDGDPYDKPKFLRAKLVELKEVQTTLSACKRGTKKRREIKKQLQKLHEKVKNQRNDFLHKLSRNLVNENKVICVEDLNIRGMLEVDEEREKEDSKREKAKNTGRRRNIGDAGWHTFTFMLVYKAAEAGRQVVKVNPKNTSKMCSSCGLLVPKKRGDRVHLCPRCKLELDRDHNAALNVLRLGRESLAASVA
jgi:putative transposase